MKMFMRLLLLVAIGFGCHSVWTRRSTAQNPGPAKREVKQTLMTMAEVQREWNKTYFKEQREQQEQLDKVNAGNNAAGDKLLSGPQIPSNFPPRMHPKGFIGNNAAGDKLLTGQQVPSNFPPRMQPEAFKRPIQQQTLPSTPPKGDTKSNVGSKKKVQP